MVEKVFAGIIVLVNRDREERGERKLTSVDSVWSRRRVGWGGGANEDWWSDCDHFVRTFS